MKNQRITLLFVSLFTAMLIFPAAGFAQKKKKDKDKTSAAAPEADKKSDIKSITEVTKKCKKIDGLFTFYQDSTSGTTYMLIKKEQLNAEYIYTAQTSDGITTVGHFRGGYRESRIITLKKYFNKIEFYKQNTFFYFDPKNALSKAADANVSNALMASLTLAAQNKEQTEFLVKADELFLNENLHQVKPSSFPGAAPGTTYSLGTMSKDKCKYLDLRSYPKNSDVEVEYVYDNPAPTVGSGDDVADERYVSIKMLHSFIEVPQNDYKPRRDDSRVGFFTVRLNDMTSREAVNYRDYINRWYLEKKDKTAAVSEPVEPITWWIENTTPVEFRETIKNAALAWNEAFERAGFKNAMVIKEQPDTATWDAGDIRYNVLRWTSSPKPPFGGYGPSFSNPRTGQLIGADIMLEFIFITNRLNQDKLFNKAGLEFVDEAMANHAAQGENYCALGEHLHQTSMFGLSSLMMAGATEVEMTEYIKQSVYYLIMHELGHTLGLNHNMKASQMLLPSELNNMEITSKKGLIGSVMDYPSVNLSRDKKKQGHYFTSKCGPYDLWAIEFGYSPALEDEKAEKARMDALLARSTEHDLLFGNDADDMRAAGRGIDPRVMVNDLSGDAISYGSERLKMVDSLMLKLKTKYNEPNQSYQELRNAYLILTGEANSAITSISRYIGGVYIERAHTGQPGATKPYTPVPSKDQKRAMDVLAKQVFGVNAFKVPSDLYNFLQVQRRGFNVGEDPKVHERILNIQKNVLTQLLHPAVQQRITDTELYGNEYKLPEVMNDLTTSIFREDMAGSVNTFRQNLQLEYVEQLIKMLPDEKGKSDYDNRSQAVAYNQLTSIQNSLGSAVSSDAGTKAHRQYVQFLIKKAFSN